MYIHCRLFDSPAASPYYVLVRSPSLASMSRKPGKARAASSKAVSSFGASPFGSFGSAASGISLSYLAEPPDFSSVSDANVVVSLKNLQKKDGTTKAKALEELLSFAQAHPYEQDGGVEEPVLEAWVHLPRPPIRPCPLSNACIRSNPTLVYP